MRWIPITLLIVACGGDAASPDAADQPTPPARDWERDILHTDLAIDLSTREATARLTLAAASSTGASFEVGDLEIAAVTDADGAPLLYEVADGVLDVGVPATGAAPTVVVSYRFQWHDGFTGADDTPLLTLTWPYYCGNVFPCKSRASPADGSTFALELSGLPDNGHAAVYPTAIPSDAPSYMPAWTVDDYVELPLGTTTAGTEVSMWHFPGQAGAAAAGGANLVAAFDWLERRIGPYLYGGKVGGVAVRWGPGAYGGMEHHPYWHVAAIALGSEEVNVHEAAHGWFGNGVRLRCWEDFVLSEGTATYLAARVLDEVAPEAGAAVWSSYAQRLGRLRPGVAWPASCGEVDILDLFSDLPYIKGAYFLRAVAERVGADTLDDALGAFYVAWAGQAAGMQDLLDVIAARTGWDPTACAAAWLRAEAVPDELGCE